MVNVQVVHFSATKSRPIRLTAGLLLQALIIAFGVTVSSFPMSIRSNTLRIESSSALRFIMSSSRMASMQKC